MGLELDTLTNNGDKVIYNNTTGQIIKYYNWVTFVDALHSAYRIEEREISKYFSDDEIQEVRNND